MKIAVTGGGGFIGAATIEEAEARGYDAWRFDRQDGNDVLGDLSELASANVVIHLAGMLGTSELFDSPEEAVETNVVGSIRILEWCRRNGAGYVGITMPDSSWANVYQATKLCSNRLTTAWHRNYGIPVSHVRAFNVYGANQKHGPGHPQKIIPTFATKAWTGEPIPIWGDGQQTVDLIHVADVARILIEAIAFGNDQIFDAGTGKDMTVEHVASIVNLMCGQHPRNIINLPMRAGEAPDTTIKAKGDGWDLLGWKPRFNLADLRNVVETYKP